MEIKRLVVGDLRSNCYIVSKGTEGIIIDPGSDADKIIEAAEGLDIVEILVTHHHFDHVMALSTIEEHYKLKHNTFDRTYFNYEVIPTPGHTSDCLTFYFKDESVMFTGDFLFYHTIGRYDLETSSYQDMIHSLDIIAKYPDDIKIYPGHGKDSILGEEKKLFSSYME